MLISVQNSGVIHRMNEDSRGIFRKNRNFQSVESLCIPQWLMFDIDGKTKRLEKVRR